MTDDPEVLQCIVNDLYQDRPQQPTLLDHFAALAMQGILTNPRGYDLPRIATNNEGRWEERVAVSAYDLAVAMLGERARRLRKD